uniref:Leucine-rich pentatricopeptide repeat containing n=1 Tax=Oryzias latipes TaxID=8090 RepID=A0A3P9IB99_ORYLA
MAALLRSARLLKISPSGFLQITGTKRNGALTRLCSGAIVSRRTGVCSCQIKPVLDSFTWPYAAVCVRNYAVATEQKNEASIAVKSKQAQQFDWALTKLESSVKRTGRITKTLLLRIFHDICRTGYPSGNQALLLLRSCGSLLPEMPLEERSVLAHRVWEKLQELGAPYDVSHYNALLKVYLQNDFKFSPTDFLAKMEAANVQPNRVTYQRLIAAYCQKGDIEGASTILGFMKSKDLPITEAVFSSLVTGHARAGDMESAKNILPVMRGAGIEPTPDTYVSLLTAYAEKGDLDGLKMTLEAAESADCSLMDRDIMQVIFTLAKAGHQELIPEMVERLRHERGYVPDAMNLCLSLITQGQEDTAFSILKTFPSLQSDSNETSNLGNFFLRHCINMDISLEKIFQYCKELQELNLHSEPLTFALSCSLEAKKIGSSLELMRLLKEQNLPIRPHYFWPLLSQPLKEKNIAGVLEVAKGMEKLGVTLDIETLSNYILPVFSDMETARQALKEAGVSMDSEGFLCSEVRSMAMNNLAKLYTTLSDPSFPKVDLSTFRTSLITGFKKYVSPSLSCFWLLFKPSAFGPSVTYSLQLIFFHFFFFSEQNITIPLNIYRGIKNLLESYHAPELIKDVVALVDPKEKGSEEKVLALENKLAELKAENKPLGIVLKQLIQALSAEENLQRALELKQQHEEEMTAGSYATLINLCCRHNNVDEALNLKREMIRKDSSVALDGSKYIALVKTLAANDRLEEAVDILKEMKEKEVVLNDINITTVFHMLNDFAAKGKIHTVRRLLDTIFSLGLAKPTANLCSPIVTAHLNSKDVAGALEATIECQKLYNQLPRIHDIIVALVEKGDTEVLQKAMDFISQERGEMTMLYDLFFAFLQTGRYREARKIIETPGLRAKPGRLQWYADKCIFNSQMESLEQMVEMTAKLFECDRDEMYSYILRLCKETNDWRKAEAIWTKMQEENVIPRERTLRLLADILKNNDQEVPFDMPEVKAFCFRDRTPVCMEISESGVDFNACFFFIYLSCVISIFFAEAFEMLKDTKKRGVVLSPSTFDHLIRTLLSRGFIEDAMVVKKMAESQVSGFQLSNIASSLLIISHSKRGQAKGEDWAMLQLDHIPSNLAIIRLVQTLGSQGDVAGIQEVQSLINSLGRSPNLSSMVFVNNTALAQIKNGDVDAAVELLDGIYTSPNSTNPSIAFIFRKLLESGNDQALDKLGAMVERLANHFACYRPATDLFLQLLDLDKVDDAKFMLARCNALAEQKDILLSFVSQKAQSPGQVRSHLWLSFLSHLAVLDKDLTSAKALYEQMMIEGVTVDELSLKRLARLYSEAGETAPFPEPPESFTFYADKLKESSAKAQTTAEE